MSPRLAAPGLRHGLEQFASPPVGSIMLFPRGAASHGRPTYRDGYGNFHSVGSTTTDGIQEAIDAVPSAGGRVYLSPGTYKTTTTITIAANGVSLIGDNQISTIISYSGTGNILNIDSGGAEIVGCHVRDLELRGNDTAAKGIESVHLKDAVLERLSINGTKNHCVDLTGGNTLNTKVRDCRLTAAVGALVTGRGLNCRAGTTCSADGNYFNIGAPVAGPARFDTAMDIRDHDNFISFNNKFDGVPTGIRSNGVFTSILEYWDTNATSGVSSKAYVLTGNANTVIIAPRSIDLEWVDWSGINRNNLTFIGAVERGFVGGILDLRPIDPAQITADQNDYAPTDVEAVGVYENLGIDAGLWRIDSDQDRTITGIDAPHNGGVAADGQLLFILNDGSNPIRFRHENGSSAAENRIKSWDTEDLTLMPDQILQLVYDGAASRWRPLVQDLSEPLGTQTITPAQLTASVNDYAPTGSQQTKVWRMSADALGPWTVTGIDFTVVTSNPGTGVPSYELTIMNVGSNTFNLGHQNAGSAADKRILSPTGADVAIAADGGARLLYDAVTLRWRITSTW